MATVKFIEERIAGKQKEIEKLEKKLLRVEMAAVSGWENNPYYYGERDLRITKREIEAAKAALKKYEEDLAKENEKALSRCVPAITEFLNRWYERCVKFYLAQYEKYLVALKECHDKDREYCEWSNSNGYRMRRDNRGEYERIVSERQVYRDNFRGAWLHVTQFEHGSLSWEETMKKDLREEYNRKYDFIIERTNEIVGEILDAGGLSIGDKGDLNGIIIGTRGKASVATFGAGGYNIQCFHFRTTIKEVK